MSQLSSTDIRCSIGPSSLTDLQEDHFDLFVASIGFERRSRFLAQNHPIDAARKIAYAFTDRNCLSFKENVEFFKANGFTSEAVSISDFAKRFQEEVSSLTNGAEEQLRICVDVSSMSRMRMANVVEVACRLGRQQRVVIDFAYCVASFSPPPNAAAFIETAGPVTPFFAGWTTMPDAPTCAFLGVGYEPDRAIGTIEYLEPGPVWAFVPEGPDPRFLEAVTKVNETLWDDIPAECVSRYCLSEPFNTFVHLESMLFSATQSYRPILVPFGPKLFTIQCLLAAVVHYPNVAVWRVSGGESAEPSDRDASGEIYVIRASFYAADASSSTSDSMSEGNTGTVANQNVNEEQK